MRLWRHTFFALWVALYATQTAVAQIEKQAATYDVTLEDCLSSTFRQYPEIQRLRADVERAAGTRLLYRSRALPQLAAQVTAGVRGGNLYISPAIKTNTSTSVITTNNAKVLNPQAFSTLTAQFSQPLIDVGIPPTLRRAKLEVVLAQQNLNREVTDRLHEVRTTFLRALYFRDLIALHEEIDKRLQANVDSEQQRLDVGTGNKAALTWARIQKLNFARLLTNLRGDYFATVTRLAELCGRDPGDQTQGLWQLRLPNPVGVLPYEPVKLDLPQESAYALRHRADLKLFQALVDALAADRQTVQAGYFPFVYLTASALFLPNNYLVHKQTAVVAGQQATASEERIGAAMSWRVIDNGQITGASRRVEAVRQSYEIDLRRLQQNIPRELAIIEGALQSADARHEAFVQSAAEAEENLKLIETQITLGEATQFDFLKAQTNLLSVRAGIADATYSHEVARAELDRVTGRYLEYRAESAQ